MERLTTKCSTILIATGDEDTRVFHSMDEVPADLRVKLLDSTTGVNAATILIADKHGREEILRAVRHSRPDRYSRLVSAMLSGAATPPGRFSRWRFLLPAAGRLFLVGCLGYVLWVLATIR